MTISGTRILLVLLPLLNFCGHALAQAQPNIVMIVVDDMRTDEYGAGGHPYLKTPNIDRLASEGATFSQAYHATPLCSPNRASILTGQYSSRHGVQDNTARSYLSHRLPLFAIELQRAGYRTAHVGKWHMGNDPTPRPGYDYWVSFEGQGRSIDPILYEEGRLHEVPGYITDIFTDRAIDFIQQDSDKPFFVYIGHKAVHPDSVQLDDGTIDPTAGRRFTPAPRHEGAFRGKTVPLVNNGERFIPGDRPALAAALEQKHSPEIVESFGDLISYVPSQDEIRDRARMMLAVDENLGRILQELESSGELDNTLVIFTSDNGYFYGEHGLTLERRMPYQEAARMPLLVRFPAAITAGTEVDGLASSVDLAPTVLDFAGAGISRGIQGLSLRPILSGEADALRDAVLVEFFAHEAPFFWTAELGYRAVVDAAGYKYIKWIQHDDREELYQLSSDPGEQHNIVARPEHAGQLNKMRSTMHALVLRAMGLD